MRLNGTKAADHLRGAAQNDTITGLGGDDRITGEGGGDQLLGGDGDDHLSGAVGDDTLDGAAGADNLDGGAGSDTYNGGAGDDLHRDETYDAQGRPVTEPLDVDVFVFEAPDKGAAGGGFGHDRVLGFDPGADQLRFAGYTAADLAGPVQVTVGGFVWAPNAHVTEWRFEFKDGSRVSVWFDDVGAHQGAGGVLVGTAPVAGQDYAFA